MSRRLLVLRHAKSAWDTEAATDFERPLGKRGKKDAPRIGRWLDEQGLVPDLVVSSPAERAEQTALKVCKELNVRKKKIWWEHRIYEAGLEELLGVLADCPQQARMVLLVGHNPGLEVLVDHLCGPGFRIPDDGKLLPTAAVALLEMPEDWSDLTRGVARLVSITGPKALSS